MATPLGKGLAGFRHVVNEDGSVTIHFTRGGTVDRAFCDWHAQQNEAVHLLCRQWQEGRRGKAYPLEDAPYRPTTRTRITIDPDTFTLQKLAGVPLGPHDVNPVDDDLVVS
jgi:hypothetical protein